MILGGRPLFFMGCAAASLLLLAPTPPEFRWVNLAMAALGVFWAVLLSIEELGQRRARTRGRETR